MISQQDDNLNAAELLDQELHRAGISQADLARRSGYSAKHVSQVLTGRKAMGPDFAVCVEFALNVDGLAETLLVAQARLEARLAQRCERVRRLRAHWYAEMGPGRLRKAAEQGQD